MSKMVYQIDSKNIAGVLNQVNQMINKAIWRGPVEVVLQRPGRTQDQNAKLWPMLRDIKDQVDWYGHKLSEEDWKNVFTSSLAKQRAVPGLDGGFVVLGLSTKKMSKERFSQLIELIYAFGSEKQVQWSEPSQQLYKQYKEAA